MKRKIFTFLLGALFITGFAQKPEGTVLKANPDALPTIDGVISDGEWVAEDGTPANVYNIDQPFQSEVPTLGEAGETNWRALWSDDGVYVAVQVTDDEFLPGYIAGGNGYEYDKVEVYFDVNFLLEDGLGAGAGSGHHQFAQDWAADNINGETVLWDNGVEFSGLVTDPNYVVEYFIPKEVLTTADGGLVDMAEAVGFDVTAIDRETGDDARKRAVWANIGTNDESWNNMDECGIIYFDGAEPGIFVESVEITGTDITENNLPMQLQATVLPEDASNKILRWTVENVTGRATIDSDGVLTPLMDGEVIVTAAATDNSYEEASLTVNISGQIVSVHELNLIRNGYFDDPGLPGEIPWWDDWANHETPAEVIEGVVNIDPSPGGANPWDCGFTQDYGFGIPDGSTDPYTLSFVAWADAVRTLNVDFEDSNNDYNRYGTSTHPFSNGESDWTFDLTTEPVHYVFDVVFDEKVSNTREAFQFMSGLADPKFYLDSIVLIKDADLALVTEYNPVTSIVVSSAGDATVVETGGTLQMSAAVLPADADYLNVRWSVMGESTDATIDANGLLTAGTMAGTVTVYAHAADDSKQMDMMEITISFPDGIAEKNLVKVNAYPNPAENELMVELSAANQTVSIYNSLGKKMDEVLVKGTQHQFDVSSYAKGLYFVKAGSTVVKFVK
jgi:uncharacterized protein YjdB